jgi:hypothetical protein
MGQVADPTLANLVDPFGFRLRVIDVGITRDGGSSAELRVARFCRLHIELADDQVELFRQGDDHADMRRVLLFVTRQQRGLRVAAQHQRELPGQVDRVADARRQPLAEKRRGLVCRIARQEDAARLPALRQQRMEVVDRRPPDRQVRGVGEAMQHLDDAFVLAEIFRRSAPGRCSRSPPGGSATRRSSAPPARSCAAPLPASCRARTSSSMAVRIRA